MKKFVVILSILLCLFDAQTILAAASAWSPPNSKVQAHQLIFLRVRDEYQLRYAINGMEQGTYQVRANFWSTTNVYYNTVFDNPTKIAYLTCNGTYIFEMLDTSGNTIAETNQIKTTKIENPACQSYENKGLVNDLNVKAENYGNGQTNIKINNIPEGTKTLDYYLNGELQNSHAVDDPGFNNQGWNYQMDGSLTIVAKDKDGNVLGTSDVILGDKSDNDSNNNGGGNGGGDGGSDNVCGDGCEWIKTALACPEWDTYMNEWKSMLQEVYQPPNWQEVANIMRDTIVPAMGDELIKRSPEMAEIFADEFTSREKPVAPPPTTPPDYKPPVELPKLNDLNQEIEFDLTEDVPEFEPDYSESEPFVIPDPLDLELSDEDQGYIYNDVEPDEKDYIYKPSIDDSEIPNYEIKDELPSDKDYDFPTSTDMPEYNSPMIENQYYMQGE